MARHPDDLVDRIVRANGATALRDVEPALSLALGMTLQGSAGAGTHSEDLVDDGSPNERAARSGSGYHPEGLIPAPAGLALGCTERGLSAGQDAGGRGDEHRTWSAPG